MTASSGQAFHKQVAKSLDLEDADPVWLQLLEQACELLDVIQALDDRIQADGPVARGSRGQPVLHPLIPEVRQQRLTLARVLKQLGLEDSHEPRAAQKKRAAVSRWDARRTA